jgi:hypothetical protein
MARQEDEGSCVDFTQFALVGRLKRTKTERNGVLFFLHAGWLDRLITKKPRKTGYSRLLPTTFCIFHAWGEERDEAIRCRRWAAG